MWKFGRFRLLRVVLFVALAFAAGGAIVMVLWNYLVPALFGGPVVRFGQAVALAVLSRLLFGRFGPGFGAAFHPGMTWRGRMMDRWSQMTPEEQQRWRERMRGRCGPRPGASADSRDPSADNM